MKCQSVRNGGGWEVRNAYTFKGKEVILAQNVRGRNFFEKKVRKNLFVSAKRITFAAGKLSKTEN